MRIEIKHETTYRYREPVIGGVQYLRLTPSPSAAQTVLHWRVRAPGRLTPWRDEQGNLCHSVTMLGSKDTIAVVAEGEVETRDTGGIIPFEKSDGGLLPEGAYLRLSPRTALDRGLIEFAEAQRAAVRRPGARAWSGKGPWSAAVWPASSMPRFAMAGSIT